MASEVTLALTGLRIDSRDTAQDEPHSGELHGAKRIRRRNAVTFANGVAARPDIDGPSATRRVASARRWPSAVRGVVRNADGHRDGAMGLALHRAVLAAAPLSAPTDER